MCSSPAITLVVVIIASASLTMTLILTLVVAVADGATTVLVGILASSSYT
jgi:hypothetical protein